MSQKLALAVTLGDPAGIGPEVTEAALQRFLPQNPDVAAIVCGPQRLADAICERLGPRATERLQAPFLGPTGRPSALSGKAALASLRDGITLAQTGKVSGLVTAPISKQALAMAGVADRGHTEILARELGAGPVAMAFFTPKLRLALCTVHIALRQVSQQLSTARVVEVATLLSAVLQQSLGIARPRLALAGLNPHAGEEGLLGDEEQNILRPAVQQARARGIDLSEPLPPDTVFYRTLAGQFDAVVALYHDQGLIPIKLLGFGEAVNVTLGLRTVRTSPDHGTAYDRVGTHTARCDGMLAALNMAVTLCANNSTDQRI